MIYCRVTEQGLVPMYDSDYDEKQRLKLGSNVLCTIKKPRNYEFHKKFFALLRLTFENLPEWLQEDLNIWSEEDLLVCLKLDLGLASVVKYCDCEVVKTGSISFASMDDYEFQRFFHRALDIILHKYLRGNTSQEVLEEISKFK